ncbi:hypothetical protein XELAEV_18033754mg [Xenopus laevis]|uniref:Uncharacterized protein n=1 Tax=Xenopus laevis TaxID=8355 RepID=A0A974CK85_XENLA|nr:hypothetical protein XELAEV_18033754mg [Xenopus laevis]
MRFFYTQKNKSLIQKYRSDYLPFNAYCFSSICYNLLAKNVSLYVGQIIYTLKHLKYILPFHMMISVIRGNISTDIKDVKSMLYRQTAY